MASTARHKVSLELSPPFGSMLHLIGGVISVLFLWTLVSGFVFTRDELVTVVNYLLNSPRGSEEMHILPNSRITSTLRGDHHDDTHPVCNVLFERNTTTPNSIPYEKTGLHNSSPTSPLPCEPLQRTATRHRRHHSLPRPGFRDINYMMKATTRRIIEKVEVVAQRTIELPNGRSDVLCFLLCTTKTGSFVAVQSYRSLRKVRAKLRDSYRMDGFPSFRRRASLDETTKRVNEFFEVVMSDNFLKSAPEVVDALVNNIYRPNHPIVVC